MLAPIIWFGGKSMMVQKLVDLIPKHEVYFEVFGGGGALLFAKQPSRVEVYNEGFSIPSIRSSSGLGAGSALNSRSAHCAFCIAITPTSGRGS